MLKRVCDICKEKEPCEAYRVKKRNYIFNFIAKDWREIDICEECYEKLFGKRKSNPPSGGSAIQYIKCK